MLRTPSPLLTGLVATSLVVSTALAWSGWRLLEQQRDLDRRLAREQVEAEANAFSAGIRERLADLGERLSARLTPSTTVARVSGPAFLQSFAVNRA